MFTVGLHCSVLIGFRKTITSNKLINRLTPISAFSNAVLLCHPDQIFLGFPCLTFFFLTFHKKRTFNLVVNSNVIWLLYKNECVWKTQSLLLLNEPNPCLTSPLRTLCACNVPSTIIYDSF